MSNPASGTSVPSIFQFDSQEVRIFVDDQGQPWFCATDVCAVLRYQNAPDAIAKHCRQKGIAKRDTLTNKGQQSLTFINEGNLYRLIKSRLPAAERFEAWVFDEVLPAIRKTGRYEATSKSSDIRIRHSAARIEVELHSDSSGNIHFIGLNQANAADMLRVTAHAVLKVAGVNCEENIV